jgi:hypothetical protein
MTEVYHAPDLFNALKAEGFTLPDETVDIGLQFPVDGVVRLTITVNMTPTVLQQWGRAIARLGQVKTGLDCHDNSHVWSNSQFGDDWTPEVGTPCDCGKKRWGAL